jgi:hypothetical protein
MAAVAGAPTDNLTHAEQLTPSSYVFEKIDRQTN